MKKKIMTVDDEFYMTKLVEGILKREGFEVVVAHSGKECLEKLKTEKPDLVILDMMMPEMSGRHVCEEIRKNPETKDLKVIFLTVATFSEAGIKNLGDLKVLDYIKKPFENDDFVARVKKVL